MAPHCAPLSDPRGEHSGQPGIPEPSASCQAGLPRCVRAGQKESRTACLPCGFLELWSGRVDSNHRPVAQATALTKQSGGPSTSRGQHRLEFRAPVARLVVTFAPDRLGAGRKGFRVKQHPRRAVARGLGAALIVAAKSVLDVLCGTDVEAAGGAAAKNIHEEHGIPPQKERGSVN